ncbi:coiled-coil domain-containing protein 39 [Drosophila grimshawi]|uniref:Coiled-coil domain-containing protein 39 n=1 Tax=Drosophila grimshawi TaxID=7222 RepID=B4JSU7_DROGR|nr:coiled-coil domain-containing protein 39 [Drosophila grimshawi]EDV94837.1 GH17462 [Drosophila grimshawi]
MNRTEDMKSSSLDEFKLEAMRSMGWAVEDDIPMANAENLAILQDMVGMRAEKFILQQRIVALDEREKVIERHKKNIEATLQQNITFFNSVKNDVLKEAHRTQLVILERNKLKEDVRKNQKELAEYTEYAEHTLCKITKNKREIDDLTKRIKTAKSSLVDWAEAMEDGNKGYQLIDRYYQDDQQRARELNTRRQLLQADIDKRRKLIVMLYDEQTTLEKNLERTACLYREAHLERRQMVETWKQAVSQMTQREMEIQNSEMECSRLIEQAEKMASNYRIANEQLNDVLENNRLVEQGIEMLNADTSEMKNEMQRLTDAAFLKDREIQALRHELENLSNMVHAQRLDNRKQLKLRDDKTAEIENFTQVLLQMEGRLRSIEDKATDANQRLHILDEMMEGEEEALRVLNKEQQRCNELLFRTQRQITELKDEEKTFVMQNDSLHSTMMAVKRSQRQVELEIKRQTEIHYDMSFKYLQVERKLAELRGKNTDPETEARNQETLAELEQYLAKLQRRLNSTEAQNKKLNYSMNALVIVYNNDAKDLELVKFKIKEAQVYCEGTIKRLRMNRYDNSEFVVELSLLKMRCCDLQNVIDKCENGTYSLNQHRLAFQRIIKDRFVELRSQQDVLLLKRKHLNEELSTLRADLGERKKHIASMRARFELTSALLGVNEDGTVITATQLKVENAQERQLLGDEGDALNKKVLKAEKEVIALENTLRQFDKSNDKYRKNLKTYDDNSKDELRLEEELNRQQEICCHNLEQLKMLRCKAERYDSKIESQKLEQERAMHQVEMEKQKCLEDAEALDKLSKELQDQKAKIDRANREIHTLIKDIKQRAIGTEYLNLFERDLNLQELESRNRKTLNLLADMANSDDDGPEIIHFMLGKGLKLPHHLKPTRSCISSRTTSYSSLDCYSVKGYSARSSTSEASVGKEESTSTRISVVSLDFPPKNK